MALEVTVRPLTAGDRELLQTATLANVNWTGEQRFTSHDVEERADLRHYTECRPERGDLGLVAERDGQPVGVVWLLFLDGRDPGYGYVADGVPELSLNVAPGHRGQGLGGRLLRRALDEARRRGIGGVSLSVEATNPAVHLYRAVGFRPVPGAAEGTYLVDL
jgi:GNAT superfamily N-acetyltransferase